ncbi:glutamine--fructose-6-phosphate transaminase (isomerizing) [Citreimonas salinaria]|uniref:Glutamine--fructose-6-phosphate aminotransferase [isomerizing] n=1 Tax=Citreimonas salinaria TaxID=321339 RepID=A0A1H3GY10_9RHOB|nr:glutamine--fructose-6-phosphate transaminase (isomerizing) [Citreimonas salinaria]SDY08017.1 glucosamine--fructose-6-phosphate aminotransferase (isomerizing) [Citreimonas salinaria]
MCGIVGILGRHEVAPALVEALRRLEYRGYDSAGIATLRDGKLDRRRAVGKLVNLSDALVHDPLPGKSGIGHTRWATHGAPTERNAHPHRAGSVAVVHNGIIENYKALRDSLAADGYAPETDTDTETVALLAQRHVAAGKDPVEAAMATIDELKGAFALVFLFDGHPDLMIGARKGSPLAIGHGEGEMFLGSDAIALAPLTDTITYLEEGDRAILTRDGVEIRDESGAQVSREPQKIRMDAARVDKGGHKHFMAKEIAEQPVVLANALQAYLSDDGIVLPEPGIDFDKVERMVMVACGTAYYACVTAKYWFEQLAGIPVEVDIASEFRYREPPISKGTVALFVSQSGETADTLAALRHCTGRADSILSVVNVESSSIARESDLALPIHAGTEIGVASTKAFTCQLNVLLLLALRAAEARGKMSNSEVATLLDELRRLPGVFNAALGRDDIIRETAEDLADAHDVLFLGRGLMFPLALEGALKLKEISYIHAEAYASGELKHGPIALIDHAVPVVVMAPRDHLFEKTVSNMQEVIARGGPVVLITDAAGAAEAGDDAWRTIVMPDVDPRLTPLLYALPAQLLAYHAAVAKGTDVDQPRNLAKSVTVE